MKICKICGRELKDNVGLSLHIKYGHKISQKEYYDTYLKKEGEGLCRECGRPTSFILISKGYHRFCCDSCAIKSSETQEKIKATNMQKYGVPNVFMSDDIKNKMKQTSMAKYGVEYASQSRQFQEKVEQTNIQRFGARRPAQSDIVKEKAKQTCLERYGVDNYRKTAECVDKIRTTKIKNGTVTTSPQEDAIYNKILKVFPNAIQSYYSEKYPYLCDIYVPEIDTYIECHFHVSHGRHKFNQNDSGDIDRLNSIKEKIENASSSKSKAFFKQLIYVWTDLDIRKYKVAEENHLNYIVWYNEEQANDWIEAQKKIRIV
jgi:csr/mutH/archaeal HJR family nuclease